MATAVPGSTLRQDSIHRKKSRNPLLSPEPDWVTCPFPNLARVMGLTKDQSSLTTWLFEEKILKIREHLLAS